MTDTVLISLETLEQAVDALNLVQQHYGDDPRVKALLALRAALAAPADVVVPPKDSEALSREVKNQLCIDGTLNQTFDNILACHEPDAIFAMLTELAHTAVDRAVIAQGSKPETSYPAQVSGNLDHGTWRWVPVEPTEEMLQVAIDESPTIIREHYARTGHYTGRASTLSTAMFADVYRAMLRAAPNSGKPSTAGEGDELWLWRNAWRDVLAERRRQISVEGWTPQHDNEHSNGELAKAAIAYLLAVTDQKPTSPLRRQPPDIWPWATGWWKPKDPRRDLVRAGALILAEIERIDRASAPSTRLADTQGPDKGMV